MVKTPITLPVGTRFFVVFASCLPTQCERMRARVVAGQLSLALGLVFGLAALLFLAYNWQR
jgi:hypothetical protein